MLKDEIGSIIYLLGLCWSETFRRGIGTVKKQFLLSEIGLNSDGPLYIVQFIEPGDASGLLFLFQIGDVRGF